MQTALVALELVANLRRMDVDLQAAIRRHGLGSEELSCDELRLIAREVGLKSALKRVKVSKLNTNYPLPAILKVGAGYAVLLKVDRQRKAALIFCPGVEQPTRESTLAELDKQCEAVIILAPWRKPLTKASGFGWFYEEVLKYRKIIANVLLGSFVVQMLGLVTPLFTQLILDKVIVHRTLTTLDVLAVGFIACITFEFFLNIVRNYIFMHTANRMDAGLGAKLFRHLFSLPYAYFEARPVGVTVARVKELDNIREFITSKSVSVIIDVLFSLVFVVVMFLYSVPLTLVVLGFLAVVSVLYVTVTPALRRRLQTKFEMSAQSQSYLVEAITGIQTVKSLAMEGSMQRQWEEKLADYLQSSFKLANMGTVAGAISNLCQRAMTIGILYLGVRLVIENKMTIGMLIAFQMYSNQFTNPVLRLVNLWNEFQQTLLAVDRLDDILEQPSEVQTSKAISLTKLQGAIKFDNVSFHYGLDEPNVLHGVSFVVEPGTSLGIVGKSGSGKSTIAKLLQRFYLANEGQIYVDGIDVRGMDPEWLRQNIGAVPQDSYLFTGTIRENIAMPRPEAPMEHIVMAAQIAGAHEFISKFPQGYDKQVGERGSALSGGQRQRVAIARALIIQPRIFIFDEATSSLDPESELIIQTNMAQIRANRTTIIISHRLSMVRDCTQLIVIDEGRILERGSHQELLAKKGNYWRLHEQQVGGQVLATV